MLPPRDLEPIDDGSGTLGGPGGAGSGRDDVSAGDEVGGGRGALFLDDDGSGGGVAKPLLAPPESEDLADDGSNGGRTGGAPGCPLERVGPLLVTAFSLLHSL